MAISSSDGPSSSRAGPSALAAAQATTALQAYLVNLIRQGIASANPALPLRVVVEQVAARPYLVNPMPRPREILESLLDVQFNACLTVFGIPYRLLMHGRTLA